MIIKSDGRSLPDRPIKTVKRTCEQCCGSGTVRVWSEKDNIPIMETCDACDGKGYWYQDR